MRRTGGARWRPPRVAVAALVVACGLGRPERAAAGAASAEVLILADAGVDAGQARELVDLLLRDGVLDPHERRILDVLRDAAGRGLPPWRLMDKVHEGTAKGIPAARIAPVLEALAEDLARAGRLLSELGAGTEAAPALWDDVMEALALGISREATRVVLAADPRAPTSSRVGALVLAAELEARGTPSALAGEVAAATLGEAWLPGEMREAPGLVDELVAGAGLVPERAARVVLLGVRAGMTPGEIWMDWMRLGGDRGAAPRDWVDDGPGGSHRNGERGRSEDAPGRDGSPGRSGDAPGQDGSPGASGG